MFQESYMRRIAALLGVMAIVALVAYTYSTVKQARYMYSGPTTISVMGMGEVFAKPDIATFSFSVEAKEGDAVTAQNKAAETMDAILAYLGEAGVEERDIKTQYYNLGPRYEYPERNCTSVGYCPPLGEPTLIGYQVSHSVSIKVRDAEKAGELVSGVGSRGALNVSSVSFTIDDEEALKAEAREKAIADAREKAKVLARNLNTRIVRMNGYWEENQGGYPIYGKGMGGDDMVEMAASAPQAANISLGENKITVQVNISYEIR